MTYLDTVAIIRLVEGAARSSGMIQDAVAGDIRLTSVIAIAECLVHPVAQNDLALREKYEEFFASEDLHIVDIDRATAEETALVRARFKLKSADALHLGAAVVCGCDRFITSDLGFRRCDGYSGLQVIVVPSST